MSNHRYSHLERRNQAEPLTISPAQHGGFVVFGSLQPGVLSEMEFAGSLLDCLGFIAEQLKGCAFEKATPAPARQDVTHGAAMGGIGYGGGGGRYGAGGSVIIGAGGPGGASRPPGTAQ